MSQYTEKLLFAQVIVLPLRFLGAFCRIFGTLSRFFTLIFFRLRGCRGRWFLCGAWFILLKATRNLISLHTLYGISHKDQPFVTVLDFRLFLGANEVLVTCVGMNAHAIKYFHTQIVILLVRFLRFLRLGFRWLRLFRNFVDSAGGGLGFDTLRGDRVIVVLAFTFLKLQLFLLADDVLMAVTGYTVGYSFLLLGTLSYTR
uniref:Uncharacterized protein n=1 Tax=Anopheles atroparvus TaxID=41427 RepID=A0AAG5DFG0_ANOAO